MKTLSQLLSLKGSRGKNVMRKGGASRKKIFGERFGRDYFVGKSEETFLFLDALTAY